MALTALLLDPQHRLLVDAKTGALPSSPDEDLARFAAHWKRRGLDCDAPIGVAPPNYAFLLRESCAPPAGYEFVRLLEAPTRVEPRYWSLYTELLLGGFVPPRKEIDVFSFGFGPAMAARLAHLVIKGKKRATSGNPAALEKLGVLVPTPGLISVVTDGFGIPLCCIETERVERHRFGDVPDAVALGEHEGDTSLAAWRAGHRAFFVAEAERLGLPFTDNSEILTEWFRVLRVLGQQ